jgi:hypothetical protein
VLLLRCSGYALTARDAFEALGGDVAMLLTVLETTVTSAERMADGWVYLI